MKKTLTVLAVLGLIAGVAFAEEVTSANIVGYTQVEAVGGEMTLVALNFNTTNNTLDDLIGTGLPANSTVYVWDKDNDAYMTAATLGGRGAWSPNHAIENGTAFWIQSAAAAGVTNTVVLSGEVKNTDTSYTFTTLETDAVGFSYPVDVDFTTTTLSSNLAENSVMWRWDRDTQGYTSIVKGGRGTWTGTGDPNLMANEGFWIQSAGDATIVEPAPSYVQ